MGEDGVVALDLLSEKVWTKSQLDDELCHDADLDTEGIFNIHFVKDDSDSGAWVHTHGLTEVGAFDFDIVEPSSEVMFNIWDLCRSMAFHVLEGSVGRSAPRFPLAYPSGDVRLAPMSQFLAGTDARIRAMLEPMDESHRRNHSVLCEPEASGLGRLFGKKSLQPSRWLSHKAPENPVFTFSHAASDLMAERAQKTYPLLRALSSSFPVW
jgi:hypothetical protein